MTRRRRISEELRTMGPQAGAYYRTGLVAEQDAPTCRVRVRFPDRDNMLSWWLPIVQRFTQSNQRFSLPDLGEQVACLMDATDEAGCVLGAIYSTADTTPPDMTGDKDHTSYLDNAVFEYDRDSHTHKTSLPDASTQELTQGNAATRTVTLGAGSTDTKTLGAGGVVTEQILSSGTRLTKIGAGTITEQIDGAGLYLIHVGTGSIVIRTNDGGMLTIGPVGAVLMRGTAVVIQADGPAAILATALSLLGGVLPVARKGDIVTVDGTPGGTQVGIIAAGNPLVLA